MFCEAIDEMNLVIPDAGQEVYNHLAMVITMAMDSKESAALRAAWIAGMQWFMADHDGVIAHLAVLASQGDNADDLEELR